MTGSSPSDRRGRRRGVTGTSPAYGRRRPSPAVDARQPQRRLLSDDDDDSSTGSRSSDSDGQHLVRTTNIRIADLKIPTEDDIFKTIEFLGDKGERRGWRMDVDADVFAASLPDAKKLIFKAAHVKIYCNIWNMYYVVKEFKSKNGYTLQRLLCDAQKTARMGTAYYLKQRDSSLGGPVRPTIDRVNSNLRKWYAYDLHICKNSKGYSVYIA